jgi:hypothetical protein
MEPSMSTNPYEATITIKIKGESPDEAGIAFQNAVNSINSGISSGGNGITPNGTSYTYEVESNQPKAPMTMDTLFAHLLDNADPEEKQELQKSLRELWGYER